MNERIRKYVSKSKASTIQITIDAEWRYQLCRHVGPSGTRYLHGSHYCNIYYVG